MLIGHQYLSLIGSRSSLSVCYEVSMSSIHCVQRLTDSSFKTNAMSHAVKIYK